MKKRQYFAKCSGESLTQAREWGLFNNEREAIKDGLEGCKNGMGRSFRVVEVITTYRISNTKFKYIPNRKQS